MFDIGEHNHIVSNKICWQTAKFLKFKLNINTKEIVLKYNLSIKRFENFQIICPLLTIIT